MFSSLFFSLLCVFQTPFNFKPLNFLLYTLLTQTFHLPTTPLLPNHYKFTTTSQSFSFTLLFSKYHNILFLFIFPSLKKMPHRVVRPRGDMDYMGIVFVEGIDGYNQRSRYHRLFKRDVLATRYPENVTLSDLVYLTVSIGCLTT